MHVFSIDSVPLKNPNQKTDRQIDSNSKTQAIQRSHLMDPTLLPVCKC